MNTVPRMHILIVEQIRSSSLPIHPFEKLLLTAFAILPTLQPRRLAAITPRNHTVKIINERYEPITDVNSYDLILIHFTTVTANQAYALADTIRKKTDAPIVFCGLHAAAVPKEALKHADSLLIGKNETNWLTLIRDVEQHTIKTSYPPEKPLPKNIPPTQVQLPGFQIVGAIEATRGCPYQCSFCPESQTPSGNQFFKRPVDEVIQEIKQLPYKIIMFYDASLTINPAYTKELFTKMIPLKKRFFCNGNVDALSRDEELIRLSKKAGCIAWLIGFESFSEEVINAVGKKTNSVAAYKQVVNQIHKQGMIVIGDFMFGFDADKPTVFSQTLSAIQDLAIDIADFTVVTPFPGTPLFSHLTKEQRLLTTDWSQYTLHTVVFKPKNMTPSQLQQGVHYLYQEFYRPIPTLIRLIKTLRYGIIPFVSAFSRSILPIIASMKQQKNTKGE